MSAFNVSEEIKNRQNRNREIHLKRVTDLEETNPEYKALVDKRNSLLADASLLLLQGQTDKATAYRKEAEKLDVQEKKILASLGLPPDYLDEIVDCKKCNDQGFLPTGEVCDCLKKLIRQSKYSHFDLTEEMSQATFENFDYRLFSTEPDKTTGISSREAIDELIMMAHNFCDHFNEKSSSLFIFGKPGHGKTYFVSCIVNELIKRDTDVIYISAPTLLEYLYEDIAKRQNLESSYKDEFKNVELLVIDDLGTEKLNDFSISALSEIIDSRILKNKSTIITSNLSPNDILTHGIYPDRMSSRIIGCYKQLFFNNTDLRLKLKNFKI